MLRFHKGHFAAHLLGRGHDMQGQCGLTGGLGAVDFDDSAAGVTSDAEGVVEGDGAGGDYFDVFDNVVAHLHDCATAVGLLDAAHSLGESVEACGAGRFFGADRRFFVFFLCHNDKERDFMLFLFCALLSVDNAKIRTKVCQKCAHVY